MKFIFEKASFEAGKGGLNLAGRISQIDVSASTFFFTLLSRPVTTVLHLSSFSFLLSLSAQERQFSTVRFVSGVNPALEPTVVSVVRPPAAYHHVNDGGR
jgi:hypothetical protein